ncbi:type II toxin-antitoxin system PemK/MazF family toxin [Sphingomonas sp.]|uniref:type II toxin-antitoxin system PemK/MazF family toxin n=1 Tax=Sphingomonas sp. TaxID=28214 RepID=UPI0025D6FD9D|nr:type II toxin-antitoxin system PemK/MazF family toxin [Sphingomonas sp.]
MKRGEIWLCALDPTVGREIQKTRPCLIVSPDQLNARLPTVIVAPLTSGSRPARYRVDIRFQGKDSRIIPEQVRAIDRRRARKLLGELDAEAIRDVLRILQEMFAE